MKHTPSSLAKYVQSSKFKGKYEIGKKAIEFGKKLYGRRIDLGLTQSKLAKKVGTTQRKISMLENGTYENIPSMDLIERLSLELTIDIEYFIEDFIERRTFEMYNYILSKLKDFPDKMQYMKIPYFIDIEHYTKHHVLLTNYNYIRYQFGPFDKKVYNYQRVFTGNEKGFPDIKYTYLTEEDFNLIDSVTDNLPINSGSSLKRKSYNTPPMKKLGATLGGQEGWCETLDFNTILQCNGK